MDRLIGKKAFVMKLTLIMALTVDGKIGKDDRHFPDWTGPEDKKMFKEMTLRAGVVIMGSKTYDTIGKPLPGRKNVILTRNPRRISDREDLVFTDKHPGAILRELAETGFREAVLAGGARVNYLFAQHRLIDELVVTFAPRVFGSGLSLFADSICMGLALEEVQQLGENLILARYRVIK